MILFTACATKPTQVEGNASVVEMPVVSDKEGVKPVIDVDTEITSENQPQENVYKKKAKNTKISLHLGPGLYNTFSYVGFFKGLEKNRIKVASISGIEFGALMAALYAKHKKSSLVEWQLFKLLQEMGNETKVYSPAWNSAITELIQKNFAHVDFNQLDMVLKIPVRKSDSYEWVEDGNVAEALISSLGLDVSIKSMQKAYGSVDLSNLKTEDDFLVTVDVLSQNQGASDKSADFKELVKILVKSSLAAKNYSDLHLALKYSASELDRSNYWQKNNPAAIKLGNDLSRKMNQVESTKSEP